MTKASIILSSLAVAIVLAVAGYLWYGIFTPVSHDSATTVVSIEKGTSLSGMAQILEQRQVIRSGMLFTLYARFSGKGIKLRAGEYVMPLNLTIPEVTQWLVEGRGSSNDVSVTIPEGFTNIQISKAVHNAGVEINEQEFIDAVSTGFIGDPEDSIYDGKPANVDLTGYLFPDTYKFFGNSSVTQVAEKMVDTLKSKLTDTMRQQIDASPYSFYQLLTLASIVEKEVRTLEEKKIVAGIFLNRLEDNYPLQSDATLNFITGKKDTRPSASDIAVDSPYNSYAHAGLPPTPICNPGIDAISAVLEPTRTDYYFFLTTPEGKAVYSTTYAEHLQKKAQYYP